MLVFELFGFLLAVLQLFVETLKLSQILRFDYRKLVSRFKTVARNIAIDDGLFKTRVEILLREVTEDETQCTDLLNDFTSYTWTKDARWMQSLRSSLDGDRYLTIEPVEAMIDSRQEINRILDELREKCTRNLRTEKSSRGTLATLGKSAVGAAMAMVSPRVRADDLRIPSMWTKMIVALGSTMDNLERLQRELRDHTRTLKELEDIRRYRQRVLSSCAVETVPSPSNADYNEDTFYSRNSFYHIRTIPTAAILPVYESILNALVHRCHELHLRLDRFCAETPEASELAFVLTQKLESSAKNRCGASHEVVFQHASCSGDDAIPSDEAIRVTPISPCKNSGTLKEEYGLHKRVSKSSGHESLRLTEIRSTNPNVKFVPLAELFEDIGQIECRGIAVYLARLVLAQYFSPWVNGWTVQNITFARDQSKAGSCPEPSDKWLPHILLSSDTLSKSGSVRNNEGFYDLGLVLLQMGLGKVMFNAPGKRLHETLIGNLNQLVEKKGRVYANVVEMCLDTRIWDLTVETTLHQFRQQINLLDEEIEYFTP